ncbi:PREDICTED: B-cell receptor CD22 isoform X1 [Propithecus coquereli]|uniref:B-cell receptor CD22 isoform X1 n=1 Tax=Propithecus coquereli TaxID=379532 RepID=UPI00063F6A8C|nr:PREDICTED: B-cell receptor CD22 isoform X1 [Propithecus coquereli]
MHLLGPWLLLLECLAFSDSHKWSFYHPHTVYAWEGACVWISCKYTTPKSEDLENVTVYHNAEYSSVTKSYSGTILYRTTKIGEPPSQQERVRFLGGTKNNCSLSISRAHVNDSGRLGLRMMSKTDRWMEEIHLNVSERPLVPRIRLPPEIRESQEATLTCWLNFTCFGYRTQWQWSLEEEPADPSTSTTATTDLIQSELKFQPQWRHHGKNVTCQLWSDREQRVLSEETVRLDVKHRPKLQITVSPREATVKEGDSVSMTCKVVSSNPEHRTVSWLKDGAPLSVQETPTLTLHPVARNMSGQYSCQASNNLGTSESGKVALEVQYAPEPSTVQILQLPVIEGKTVELMCTSRANPPPTNYTWYHDGKDVPGNTEKTLWIPEVLLSHAGTYSCLAENALGLGQIGPGAELDVQYAPKNVTAVIQNPTPIREGDRVTVSCNYNSSNPRVTRYQWSHRGSWGQQSPGLLVIQKVAWDDKTVTCAACNSWCSWAPPVNLNVHYAPRDVRVLQTNPRPEIHSGHPVVLQCDFSSSRPGEVRFIWKKNGSFLGEGRELSFNSVSPEDAGNYSCSVSNSIGQTASEAWGLQVLYAPRRLRVSMAPGDSVMEGEKAALTCESDANPPVSQYSWFDWNNQNLRHAGRTLRLDPAKVEHSGAYWCRGASRLGVGESPPSTLTVYYSPETIGRRAAVVLGLCLALLILVIFGVKFWRNWKRSQSQQGLQENSSGQSFFVRNKKMRRTPLSEGSHAMGCCNPVMEDGISYAALRFPETDTPGTGDAGSSGMQGLRQDGSDAVTYSVVQKRRVGDYENVAPNSPEDEGIHYSELIQFGAGERPRVREDVEYVTLKH